MVDQNLNHNSEQLYYSQNITVGRMILEVCQRVAQYAFFVAECLLTAFDDADGL
jgi:hypothetical protein